MRHLSPSQSIGAWSSFLPDREKMARFVRFLATSRALGSGPTQLFQSLVEEARQDGTVKVLERR